MTMVTPDGRQTFLQEFDQQGVDPISAFPYLASKKLVDVQPGRKTHLVHRETLMGDVGETACGRYNAVAEPIETELKALNTAKGLCHHCKLAVDDSVLEHLARMANAQSQHEITIQDIKDA